MEFLRYMLRRQPVALGLCCLAMLAVLFFGGRFASDALYFNDPAHKNQPLEPWMSPRYVGMSYGLPRPVIEDIMGLEREENRKGPPPRVRDIAENLGLTLPELEVKVRATAEAFQENPEAFRHLRDDHRHD